MIPGLQVAIPFGYFSGLYLLTRPWGTPKYQLLSFPFYLSLIYTPFFIFMNVDIVYHYSDRFYTNSKKSVDRVDTLVQTITVVELILSSCCIRLIFYWKAKKIADLLARLQTFAKYRLIPWFGPNTKMDTLVILIISSSTLTVFVLDGFKTYVNADGRSWLREWVGPWLHMTGVVFSFIMPLMVPMFSAFGLIVTFTGYLRVIFEDYCQHVLDLVQERKWQGMSIISPYYVDQTTKDAQKKEHFTDKLRLEIVRRFEIVREVFAIVQEIIGPLALVLLSGSSIALVMKSYEILLLRRNYIVMARDACHLVNYLCYLWILECGQRISNKISEMKKKLDDMQVDLSSETHYLEKQTIRDVQSLIKFWDWKFTACGYFVIDRALVSGVVSIIMNYVVVLVQLKVSDEPDSVNE